jgi:integrase
MGITFNLELNSKATKNKTYAIFLRITQNKKHTRKKTTVEVKRKSDFNSKAKSGNWIRSSEPNHKVWNDALEKEIEDAKKAYRKLKSSGLATKELIKSKITSADTSPSFLDFAKERTQDIFNKGGYRNYKKYNGFCNKLEAYLSTIHKKDVLFSEVTTSFLGKFESYLYTLCNARNSEAKLHPSTISLTLRIFKTLINRAIAEKIITPEMNPFLGFTYTKTIASPKDKLNESEITAIEELDLAKDTLIWHCRNYFLFSFYMAGIRAGDFMQLRWSNVTLDGRLEYRMGKTKKDRSIFLHAKAMDIIKLYHKEDNKPNHYIFPLLDNSETYAKAVTEEEKATMPPKEIVKLTNTISSKNALINKYLKKIANKAEINKNISFHIARHSFAKIAKDKGVDNSHLKNILGHSNIKITEVYMGNFDTQETDAVMSSIFEEKPDALEIVKEQLAKLDPDVLDELLSEIRNGKSNKNV